MCRSSVDEDQTIIGSREQDSNQRMRVLAKSPMNLDFSRHVRSTHSVRTDVPDVTARFTHQEGSRV